MMSFYGSVDHWARLNLFNVPMCMLAYYTMRFVQIPLIYQKDRKLIFVLSFLVSSVILTVCFLYLERSFMHNTEVLVDKPFFTLREYFYKTIRFYAPTALLITFEFQNRQLKEIEHAKDLSKEKLSSELRYLKAQIDPEFLFRTLAHLNELVDNRSPLASSSILKLSGILDYTLYKGRKERVSLSDEIIAIEDFIELERIERMDSVKVELNVTGDKARSISPLSLLNLVKEAFRVYTPTSDSLSIIMNIDSSSEGISLKIKRSKKNNDSIGLKDSSRLNSYKRQLQLSYPAAHTLNIEESEDDIVFSLKISTE